MTCGRFGRACPHEPIIDEASLPTDLDLFRVGNFATMIIGAERFVDSVSPARFRHASSLPTNRRRRPRLCHFIREFGFNNGAGAGFRMGLWSGFGGVLIPDSGSI
ncbi:hypothetical protein HUA76_02375 [Myxococcus sp. CA056]|uniref:double-CXXCG motif protein n=1 Tax=Myxococcus sp. CA056 TaxID=2741740 RepID=UPI00157B6FB8|nr:double-CXXCG motif protein [Myxococcus sp. CA056]NTX09619.1 hypothetical protein [Myxococcus sp. CA056]